MKTLMTIILIAIMSSSVGAIDLGLLAVKDTATFPIFCMDTLGREIQSDSNHVIVWYGAEGANDYTYAQRDATGGANPVWIDSINLYGVNSYYFMDLVDDIDSNRSNGSYSGKVVTWKQGYPTPNPFTFTKVGDTGVGGDNILDHFIVEVTPGTDMEKISGDIAAADSLEAALDGGIPTLSEQLQEIVDTLQTQDGWVAQEATLAYFDTLIYVGPRGPGIYLDSAAANTNTILGADGTGKNPVSTIAAAKTLATALGYNRYYFINASTFNDAANDLASSHQNWEFIGIANSNALAFGTQRVDESRFENMNLSGTMHASGGNVLYTDCTLGYITANFNGHAFNCLLADTIVVKADQDIEFVRCQSDVGGNRTPTIDLSGGSSVVQMRDYSGGIRIMNGASNDTISIETDGQVIIASNNTSLNITLRGMITITDNGTTTNLTKDAVFTRQEADEWVWSNADTAQPDSSDLGVWLVNNLSGAGASNWTNAQRDSVLRNMEDRAISLVKLDSAFLAVITEGIWLDDGAANTSSTVGIDGTITNPVSTLAAARILADSQSLQQYYLINNSSFTLDATYEDWIFLGIGRGNLINFGSQDTDNSDFYNLMITGTQGGTGVVLLADCYLNTPDSLEALVVSSSLSDTISLRVSTATVFYQCYSNIAGNNTPGLDFNSTGTIEVLFRDYSGGITFINGISTHTVSIESDGQFIIDASCTSLNVTARGNMSITDNGTTSNKTIDAVFNVTQNVGVNWADVDNQGTSVTLGGTTLDPTGKYGITALGATTIAEYPEYAYKVIATGSPTTIAIPLSYISPTPGDEANDVFNGMIIMPITGNAAKQVRNIVDYTDTDSTLTIRPGLTTAMNSGDTAIILPSRMALEPNPLSNHEVTVSTGAVYADTVLRPPQTMVAEDTVTTGDTLAVKKDSLIYQGAGSSAEGIKNAVWGQVADTAFAAGSMGDSAKGWGATGAAPGGSGAFSCSLFAYNSGWIPNGGSPAITSGNIRMISGVNDYILPINADGWAIFSLDGGTWTSYITALRFLQDTIPQTFTFSADYVDTLTMTSFSPTQPTGDLTTLYNWIVDGNDQGKKNVVVEAYIPNKFWPVKNANKAINARHSTKTDSVGYWELQIFGNDIVLTDQGDSSSYWMATAEDGSFKHKVTVSSDSSTQLMIPDAD